ncbi:hypothetical protein SLA2020_444790 [Shorea laevis]
MAKFVDQFYFKAQSTLLSQSRPLLARPPSSQLPTIVLRLQLMCWRVDPHTLVRSISFAFLSPLPPLKLLFVGSSFVLTVFPLYFYY